MRPVATGSSGCARWWHPLSSDRSRCRPGPGPSRRRLPRCAGARQRRRCGGAMRGHGCDRLHRRAARPTTRGGGPHGALRAAHPREGEGHPVGAAGRRRGGARRRPGPRGDARGLRGRRRPVLPGPLALRGRLRRGRPARGADHRPRPPARRGASDRLPRAASTPRGSSSPSTSPRGPRSANLPPLRGPDGGPAGGDHPRVRVRELRAAALPHRAAAGDADAVAGCTTASSRSPSATCCTTSPTWSTSRPRSTAPSTSAGPTSSPTWR